MKNKMLLLLSCLFLTFPIWAQTTEWSKQLNGTGFEECRAITCDGSGNMLIAGLFDQSIDLGGGITMTSHGDKDIFLLKLDSLGNTIWARQIGGAGADSPQDLKIDAAGNLYVCGSYSQTVDFDPGPGVFNLNTSATYEAFLLKLDPQGNLIWVKQFPSDYLSLGNDITLDGNGNLYLIGDYKNNMDADPGPDLLQLPTTNSVWNSFAIKLNTSGNLLWARSLNNYSSVTVQSAVANPNGDLIITGWFDEATDFDPGPGEFNLDPSGYTHAFFWRLDAAGNLVWAKQIEGAGDSYASTIKTDPAGNFIIGGYFGKTLDFDPGAGVFPLTGGPFNYDPFVLKLNQNGDFINAFSAHGNNGEMLTDMEIDSSGNIYATGTFSTSVDFDPDTSQYIVTTPVYNSSFFWKLDFAGHFAWQRFNAGSCGNMELALSPRGKVLAAGDFSHTMSVDSGNNGPVYTATGIKDIFIQDIEQEHDLHGRVFYDENQNGLLDSLEKGVMGVLMEAPVHARYASTDQDGRFHFYDNISGDTIRPHTTWPGWTVTPPFVLTNSVQNNLLFAASGPPVKDICITAVAVTPFRRGFQNEVEITVVNIGHLPVDSIPVMLKITTQTSPDPVLFTSAMPQPLTETSDEISWLVMHLEPGQKAIIKVHFHTPNTIAENSPIVMSMSALLADDFNQFNNGIRLEDKAVGSLDPNDKQVFPAAVTLPALDTTVLKYVVRFQNTGTYEAEFVVIRDTLPAGLDLSTLQILAASHPFSWRLTGPRVLEVRFEHIHLPDSTSNEPESHGYVQFSVKPKGTFATGSTVLNEAGIYFDYNNPVITNKAKMTVVSTSTTRNPVEEIVFTIKPNPASENASVALDWGESFILPAMVNIFDATGKLMLTQSLAAGKHETTIRGLPAGQYFVQLRVGRRVGGKVLVVK